MDQMDLLGIGVQIGMYFVPFLFALCFHEFAHGWVAHKLGDNTAERYGRLTLNPLAHADPLGTWVLPLMAIVLRTNMMFGWAKPVPIDERNLSHPRRDVFWISLAGPASNLLLAVISTVLLGGLLALSAVGSSTTHALTILLTNLIGVNIFLAVFNMIPIHPLDGGKVIAPFLPLRWNIWLDQHQSQLSMGLFVGIILFGGVLAVPVQWLAQQLLDVAQIIAIQLS